MDDERTESTDSARSTRDDGVRRGITRKNVLKAAVAAVPIPLLLGGVALARDSKPSDGPLTPTPYCDDGDDPTPPQIEGPYFKPNSPLRDSLIQPGTQAPGSP